MQVTKFTFFVKTQDYLADTTWTWLVCDGSPPFHDNAGDTLDRENWSEMPFFLLARLLLHNKYSCYDGVLGLSPNHWPTHNRHLWCTHHAVNLLANLSQCKAACLNHGEDPALRLFVCGGHPVIDIGWSHIAVSWLSLYSVRHSHRRFSSKWANSTTSIRR